MSKSAKTELEKQFANIVKYLAFAACAAKAPVSQSLTKEIDGRVKIAGSAENVQRWMFWTVPQATFFANAASQKKVLLLGGNGVGKTVLMIQRAKELSILGEQVIFYIGSAFSAYGSIESLLQLQLQTEFEDFQTENPRSKKIQVRPLKSLKSFHPYDPIGKIHCFIDEIDEKSFKDHASTLETKSLWVAVSFSQYSKDFENADEAINHFKSQYPDWYIEFFSYILRTTQNVAKELKKPSRSNYLCINHREFNIESKLNNLLDIPKNIQEGPEAATFEGLPLDQFCQKVFSTFNEIGKNDVALVVLDKYVGAPVKSISSKTSNANLKKSYFLSDTNYSVSTEYNDYDYTMAFLLQTIPNSGRESPLIWLEACSFNSKIDEIKDWIRGKLKCDLITDRCLIHGFEASTCISFSSSNTTNILSRTRVKHINFCGTYENVDF